MRTTLWSLIVGVCFVVLIGCVPPASVIEIGEPATVEKKPLRLTGFSSAEQVQRALVQVSGVSFEGVALGDLPHQPSIDKETGMVVAGDYYPGTYKVTVWDWLTNQVYYDQTVVHNPKDKNDDCDEHSDGNDCDHDSSHAGANGGSDDGSVTAKDGATVININVNITGNDNDVDVNVNNGDGSVNNNTDGNNEGDDKVTPVVPSDLKLVFVYEKNGHFEPVHNQHIVSNKIVIAHLKKVNNQVVYVSLAEKFAETGFPMNDFTFEITFIKYPCGGEEAVVNAYQGQDWFPVDKVGYYEVSGIAMVKNDDTKPLGTIPYEKPSELNGIYSYFDVLALQ